MTTTVAPTTNTEATARLREAIDLFSDALPTVRQPRSPWEFRRIVSDQTQVPRSAFTRMQNLATRLGFTVHPESLGETGDIFLAGYTTGYPHFHIGLHNRMTTAMLFRTLCHELSHVILGHLPRNARQMFLMNMRGSHDENPREELAVELASAAVCHAAGLADGQFALRNLASKLDMARLRRVPEDVREAALLAARVLWAALYGEAA